MTPVIATDLRRLPPLPSSLPAAPTRWPSPPMDSEPPSKACLIASTTALRPVPRASLPRSRGPSLHASVMSGATCGCSHCINSLTKHTRSCSSPQVRSGGRSDRLSDRLSDGLSDRLSSPLMASLSASLMASLVDLSHYRSDLLSADHFPHRCGSRPVRFRHNLVALRSRPAPFRQRLTRPPVPAPPVAHNGRMGGGLGRLHLGARDARSPPLPDQIAIWTQIAIWPLV
jgi:hypothetical protein